MVSDNILTFYEKFFIQGNEIKIYLLLLMIFPSSLWTSQNLHSESHDVRFPVVEHSILCYPSGVRWDRPRSSVWLPEICFIIEKRAKRNLPLCNTLETLLQYFLRFCQYALKLFIRSVYIGGDNAFWWSWPKEYFQCCNVIGIVKTTPTWNTRPVLYKWLGFSPRIPRFVVMM